ncbi:MAG: PQQ-dependent sugar dehydrogenase, partial [Verrucomicrobiota bacterium]
MRLSRLPVILVRIAACALSLPLWLTAQQQPGFPGAAAPPLPAMDNLKTALTLSDAQVAQISPLLDAITRSQQQLAAAQSAATAASTAGLAAIGAILTDPQKPLLAGLTAQARGGPRGGGGGRRGGAGVPANSMPYLSEPTLGGLTFEKPLDIVTAPGEPRSLYILEKEAGRIIRIADVTKPEKVTFLDISAEIGNLDNERGLLAIAFHPDYQRNHQFYIWFTASNADGSVSFDRLARFTTGADGKADPTSEQPLISQADRANNHNGGQLAFGPDGYLYLSMGDEGGSNGEWQNSQLIDKNFFSGMIRIDVD